MAQHAPAAPNHRLHASMWWSALLIGLMPYALALLVVGVVVYHRRRHSRPRAGDGDGPDRGAST